MNCAQCRKEDRVLYLWDGICETCLTESTKKSLKDQIRLYEALATPPRDVIARLKRRLADTKSPWDGLSPRRRRYYQLSNRHNQTQEEQAEWERVHAKEGWKEGNPVDQETCSHPDVEPV